MKAHFAAKEFDDMRKKVKKSFLELRVKAGISDDDFVDISKARSVGEGDPAGRVADGQASGLGTRAHNCRCARARACT